MIIRRYILFPVIFCFAGLQLSCKTNDTPKPLKEPAKLYFYSVTASPTHNESITLKNNSGNTIDLGEYIIGDKNDPDAYRIPANTVLAQGQTITFSHTTLGFQINDAGEILYLKQNSTVIDVWAN